MGKYSQKETMICRRCRELVDVVVRVRTPRTFPVTWTEKVRECPKCGGTETLEPWQDQRCPKCGGAMKQGERLRLWD